jgi:hypothetical protein
MTGDKKFSISQNQLLTALGALAFWWFTSNQDNTILQSDANVDSRLTAIESSYSNLRNDFKELRQDNGKVMQSINEIHNAVNELKVMNQNGWTIQNQQQFQQQYNSHVNASDQVHSIQNKILKDLQQMAADHEERIRELEAAQ